MTNKQDEALNKDFLKETNKNPSNIIPEKLSLDSPLKFACHPGVSCFTACCHAVQIILTPYDILILRQRLGLSAHEFLSQYTEPTYLEKTDMPGVQIKNTGDTKACPFVTPEGCTVYNDRPSACRYYPVGMADFHEGGQEDQQEEKFFFLVKEAHCKGFDEDKRWTIREWRADQGLDLRDEMNKEWLRLVMRRKSFGHQANLSEPAQRMFFMASTDLDHFRKFIFESSFLQTYELDAATIELLRSDDVALMRFSFTYLAHTLFGVSGMQMNLAKIKERAESMHKEQEETFRRLEEDYKQLKAERAKQSEG